VPRGPSVDLYDRAELGHLARGRAVRPAEGAMAVPVTFAVPVAFSSRGMNMVKALSIPGSAHPQQGAPHFRNGVKYFQISE